MLLPQNARFSCNLLGYVASRATQDARFVGLHGAHRQNDLYTPIYRSVMLVGYNLFFNKRQMASLSCDFLA